MDSQDNEVKKKSTKTTNKTSPNKDVAASPKKRGRPKKVKLEHSLSGNNHAELPPMPEEREPSHILGFPTDAESQENTSEVPLSQEDQDIIENGIIDHGEDLEYDDDEEVEELIPVEDDGSAENDVEDDDITEVVDSNGVVELSPTTATVVSPSGSGTSSIRSPDREGDGIIVKFADASSTTPVSIKS